MATKPKEKANEAKDAPASPILGRDALLSVARRTMPTQVVYVEALGGSVVIAALDMHEQDLWEQSITTTKNGKTETSAVDLKAKYIARCLRDPNDPTKPMLKADEYPLIGQLDRWTVKALWDACLSVNIATQPQVEGIAADLKNAPPAAGS